MIPTDDTPPRDPVPRSSSDGPDGDRAPTPRPSPPRPPTPDSDDPSVLWLAPGVWVRRRDLGEQFVRSSGPGGQAVNKLSTAVLLRVSIAAIHGLDGKRLARLRHLGRSRITNADEILIQSQEGRTQLANRRACEERLIDLVRRAWTLPKTRKKRKPSKAAKERRLKAKRKQSDKKKRRREDRPDH